MKKNKIAIFLLLIFICGCGYTFGSLVPSHIKTIYIETFVNKTAQPNIDIAVTNAIKDHFAWDSALEIVNSKEKADSMLRGEIIDYLRQPLSYSEDDEVAEYKLVLKVNMTYIDLTKDKIMWEEKNFKVDSEYYTTMSEKEFSSANLDEKSEQELRENAAKELAKEVVSRTVEGW